MTPELLRQPDKYMKYGFVHQPWGLMWKPITSGKRGRYLPDAGEPPPPGPGRRGEQSPPTI